MDRLGHFSLETGRLKDDLTEVYKIMMGTGECLVTVFFPRWGSLKLEGTVLR